MNFLRRSAPAGAVSSASRKSVKEARSGLKSFVRSAGPVTSWTADQRATHGRLVSTAQSAELDVRDDD